MCGPCRGFTPVLAEYYKKNHDSKKLEIVFVSADQNDAKFKEYFAEMPWLAVSFDEDAIKVGLE
jgi:nucleoredoxin